MTSVYPIASIQHRVDHRLTTTMAASKFQLLLALFGVAIVGGSVRAAASGRWALLQGSSTPTQKHSYKSHCHKWCLPRYRCSSIAKQQSQPGAACIQQCTTQAGILMQAIHRGKAWLPSRPAGVQQLQ